MHTKRVRYSDLNFPLLFMQKLFVWLIAVVAVTVVGSFAYEQYTTHSASTEGTSGSSSSVAVDIKKPADPRVTAAWEMMIGNWSSEDDRNFNREYKNDGTVIDAYASATGETKTEAEWVLYTSLNNIVTDFQQNNSDVYVMQTEKDGHVTHYRIVSVTPTELELANMTMGGGLKFGKLSPGALQDGIED